MSDVNQRTLIQSPFSRCKHHLLQRPDLSREKSQPGLLLSLLAFCFPTQSQSWQSVGSFRINALGLFSVLETRGRRELLDFLPMLIRSSVDCSDFCFHAPTPSRSRFSHPSHCLPDCTVPNR